MPGHVAVALVHRLRQREQQIVRLINRGIASMGFLGADRGGLAKDLQSRVESPLMIVSAVRCASAYIGTAAEKIRVLS
jgi:hypothetical protein